MARAFAGNASLEMVVKTDAIAFPAVSNGLAAITDVLGSKFAQSYENVYTFCLQSPPQTPVERFDCKWMVGMSEKQTGNARVGCGRYEWTFQREQPFLVERLRITIESMLTFPPENLPLIMEWIGALPYPWCSGELIAEHAPRIAGIVPILKYCAHEE